MKRVLPLKLALTGSPFQMLLAAIRPTATIEAAVSRA